MTVHRFFAFLLGVPLVLLSGQIRAQESAGEDTGAEAGAETQEGTGEGSGESSPDSGAGGGAGSGTDSGAAASNPWGAAAADEQGAADGSGGSEAEVDAGGEVASDQAETAVSEEAAPAAEPASPAFEGREAQEDPYFQKRAATSPDGLFECVPPDDIDLSTGEVGDFEETGPVFPPPEQGDGADVQAEVSDGSQAADEGELADWREAVERYKNRAEEFGTEVARVVRRRYEEEVRELRSGYDRMVAVADEEERALRTKAIELHEAFIREHPNSAYTARRMFRLAELYFEVSDEEFLLANDEYMEVSDLFDEGKVDYLPEPPTKDYRKSIALYKRIIKDHSGYEELGAVYYMLGYTYSDETGRHLDPERAEQTYRDLLANVPESPYRAQAYFRLGDIYFEENQHQRALSNYRAILEEFNRKLVDGPLDLGSDRLYELALYKLAWAYYKVDDLDVAIDRFVELIDWSEEKEARTGRPTDLKVESIRYLAISLTDKAVETGVEPITLATLELAKKGQKPWTYPVLKELAGILKDQARYEEAIQAYKELQRAYPLSPDGPTFANLVIQLYANLPAPDPLRAARDRIELVERYGAKSEWYEANKNNKEAITASTGFILESLRQVAYEYHTAAQNSGDSSDYLLAAQKYEEYLEQFPFAEDAYELNYYLADCYFWIGNNPVKTSSGEMITGWERAIQQYERLFGFPEIDYREEAIKGVMYSYNYLWKAREADVTTQPAALANTPPALGERVQYPLLPISELTQKYIQAIRWVEAEVKGFEGIDVLLYDIGQVYYYSNRFWDARRIFMEIVERFPETDFASFAAGLIVDSYKLTGDFSRMRAAAERFAAMELGEDEELGRVRNETFATLARQSTFKDGEIAYGEENFECALVAFLDFFERYGDEGTDAEPKNIDFVVYNIAQSYSKLGKTQQSNDFFELLLERFPRSTQAPATFWKMASNYERVLELSKAVRYYEDILTYHSGHEDASNALYNAAFLKLGLKRFEEAARTFEQYHDKYTDLEDSKNVLFRAAETWETAEDKRQAKRIYRKWLKLYGDDDADRWVETQRKLADYALEEGKRKEAEKIVQLIYDSYGNIKDDLGGIGMRISAEIAFQPLVKEFEEYEKLQFPNTQDQEELQKILTEKLEWNQRVAKSFDDFVLAYPDFLWQSAALYYKALSFKRHGESWLNAPVPFDADDPDQEEYFYAYVDLLSEKAQPFEDTAIKLFETVYDFARQKKRYNEWVGRALEELSRTDPNTYPVPKPERSTVIPSDAISLPKAVEKIPEMSAVEPEQQPASRFAAIGEGQ